MQIIKLEKNRKYLQWLKTHQCFWCNRPGVDPHHLTIEGQTRRSRDAGNAIPLCRSCHSTMHDKPMLEKQYMETFKLKAQELWEEYNKL